jgi:hypothetical protein
MNKRTGHWSAQMTLTALLAALPSFGASTATLTGTIADPSGRAIPGVTVTATRQESDTPTASMTNEAGVYSFSDLQIGTYRIQVSKDGFKTFLRSGIELHVQDEVALNISLELGSVSESVSVEAEAPLVQSTGMGVSTVIDRRLIEELPLNGRSFQTLFQLTPGVVIAPASAASQGQFSVNGQRTNSNYMMVDGVSANVGISPGALGQTAAGTQMGTTILGGTNNLVSVDALQEFRIETSSFAPEYGRTPGGQVLIVTRSGTNQFHGALFESLRNNVFDANDWFANQKTGVHAPLRQNQFGAAVGGPIWKNRTFFFVSYEGLRLLLPQTIVGIGVPSLSIRQSAPAALQPFLNAYPVPNGPDLPGGFAQLNASFSNPSSSDSTSVRIDQRLGNAWTIFGRYVDAPSTTDQRGGVNTSLSTIDRSGTSLSMFTAGATWIVSPKISNDARFNITTNHGTSRYLEDNFMGAVPLPQSLLCPYSGATSSGCDYGVNLEQPNTVLSNGAITDNAFRQFNVTDAVTLQRGSHRFAVGLDIRSIRDSVPSGLASITAVFAGLGSAAQKGTFLSGVTTTGAFSVYANDLFLTYNNFSFFGQDTWQVNTRLNVTYGLRWDISPSPQGPHLWSATGVGNPAQLALGNPGGAVWPTRFNNFAPRLGLAYSVFQKTGYETVVRAGAGTFFDLVGSQLAGQLLGAPNSYSAPVLAGVSFPYSPLTQPAPPKPPYQSAFYGADPNLLTPSVYEWNLALQQGLGRQRLISLTYLGSKGIHLSRQDLLYAPNATFPAAVILNSNADSRYNALQVQYQQRLLHGLEVLGNYTLGHSIDTVSTDTATLAPTQRLDPRSDKASSDFDIRHSGSLSLTYAVPGPKGGIAGGFFGGWALDGMFIARSAFPVNVTISRNLGYGSYPYRPDLVGGVPLYLHDPNIPGGTRINPAAFAITTDLRQGTLGRNALNGFGMYQMNNAVYKTFHVTEKVSLQLRGDFFNLTNHPNFASPNASPGTLNAATGVFVPNSLFGLSSMMLNQGLGTGGVTGGFSPLYQIGGPRSIQFTLRLVF